jgi:hypothetical protein
MLSIGLIFWLLMILWLIFGLGLQFGWFGAAGPQAGIWGNTLLLFLLFGLLGWRVFGPAISG